MDKQLVYILANAFAGGLSGYYTNDYAVKMIFRKYWGMGGVIIDTREQFIQNMSKLVERDVINARTLAPTLSTEASKTVLGQILTAFWQEMQNEAQETSLGEVQGLSDSMERLFDFYKSYSQGPLSGILTTLLSDIKLDEVLSVEQRAHFTRQLYNLFLSELKNSNTIRDTMSDFGEYYKNHSITDFIAAEFFDLLAENLAERLANAPENVDAATLAQYIEELVENTYADLDCDQLLDEFEASIKNRSLAEILGREGTQNITRELLAHFVTMLQSARGRALLETLAGELLTELKQLDVSLYSLLNAGMRKKLDSYLRETLPWFIERLLVWIQTNKVDLELLIDRAVDQVLDEDDDLLGLKSEAKRLLKDAFVGNVAVKYELIEKIVDYIKTGADPAKAANELSEYIILQLKSRKVGELIASLENMGIIRAADGSQLILNALDKYLPQFELNSFDALFSRKLGEFVHIDLRVYFAEYFKQRCKDKLQNEILNAQRNMPKIGMELKSRLYSLAEQPLSYFVNAASAAAIGEQLDARLQKYLQEHAAEFSIRLADDIGVRLQGKQLDWAVNQDMQKRLQNYMSAQSLDKLHEIFESYKTKKLVEIYNFLSGKLTAERLSSFLGIMLTGNLDEFLQGKVEKAVAENLNAMSNEELQTMTENFMGSELGPITTLGGGMGLLIGGAAAASGIGSFGGSVLTNAAGSGVLFAGIGWLTNVVAIQMIFKPYQPWKVAGLTVPFTPGIIPKQKPRFAASMGEFIDQKLFVQERAVQSFLTNREQAQESLFKLASSDDYEHLTSLLQMYKPQISQYTLGFIQNNLMDNQDKINNVLQDEFSRLPLGVLDYIWLSSLLSAGSVQLLDHAEEIFYKRTNKLFYSQESLGAVLPKDFKTALRSGADGMLDAELSSLLEYLQNENEFAGLVDRYSANFDAFIQTPVNQLLDKERAVNIKHAVCRFAMGKIQDQDTYQGFYDWINERLEKELQPDRRLGEVLDGLLIKIVRESSEQILATVLERALNTISSNRERIKQDFHDQFMESAGLLLRAANMILDIDETVYQTIDRVIDKELKEFADCKKVELQNIIVDFVDNNLSRASIGELGIMPGYRQVMDLIARMLQSRHTANALNSLVDNLTDTIFALNIKDIMQVTNFRSLQDLYRHFWPEIRFTRYQLANNIDMSRKNMVNRVGKVLEEIFLSDIYQMPMLSVLNGVKQELLLNAASRLFAELRQNGIFANNLAKYSKGLEQELKFKRLDDLLDTNLLSRDLLGCVQVSMEKEAVRELITASVNEFISSLLDNINELVRDSSKAYFVRAVANSFVSAMSENFAALLKAMDIRSVAVRQIEAMSAENIKHMFDSFAAPYFRKIERYGLIAGLLGLLAAPLLAMLK